MTRKPDPAPLNPETPLLTPGQHPHALPSTGGCFVLLDGVPVPDPAATLTPIPDPEV